MSRISSTLMSLGISVALIAAGIWFLYHHHADMGYGGNGWGMPHHMMMGGGGMGFLVILFWVVLLTAVILLVSGMITRGRFEDHSGSRQLTDSDALNILKQRYASGEINKKEYDKIRQNLQ